MAEMPIPTPEYSTEEAALVRLFRCMTYSEREQAFESMLEILGERCSYRNYKTPPTPEEIAEEQESEIKDRLFGMWPGGWPGQQIVELDNLGDPGDWLDTNLGCSALELLFPPGGEENTAAMLAPDYLRAIREAGFPLPSDFGDNPQGNGWTDEDEQQVTAEFTAFFCHWRECVFEVLERQKPANA
jgi:hypothetical protein